MTMTRSIAVRLRVEGFHCWPEATGVRAYLAVRHRHLFHLDVRIEVKHDDRDIEFHDLLTECREWWTEIGPELGRRSCEDVCKFYIDKLKARYPYRSTWVACFEDGEVGSVLSG